MVENLSTWFMDDAIGPKSDLISKMVDQIKDVKVKSKQLNEEI